MLMKREAQKPWNLASGKLKEIIMVAIQNTAVKPRQRLQKKVLHKSEHSVRKALWVARKETANTGGEQAEHGSAWLHSRSCRRAILWFHEPFWELPCSSHHLLHMLQMVKCWSISILQIQDCLILSLVPQLHVVVSICLSELWKHTRIIVYIYLLIICWELSDLWTYSLFRNKVVSVERCNLFIGKNKITSFFVLRPLWWERQPCLLCYSLI